MPSACQGGKWRGSTERTVGQDLGIRHVTGMPQGRLTVTHTPALLLLTLSPKQLESPAQGHAATCLGRLVVTHSCNINT